MQINGPEWNAAIDRNYQAFMNFIGPHIDRERDRYALFYDGRFVAFFDQADDALAAGQAKFPNQPYAVQHVDISPADLGWFSHAID